VAVGLKPSVSAHEAPGASEIPTHWLLVSVKSRTLLPPWDSALKNSAAVPVLVTVTVCGALAVPTA
jgi:hypothetical protein